MHTQTWRKVTVCCTAIASLSGCHTFSHEHGPTLDAHSVSPVVVQDNQSIIRDQLIVLVDVTGSIGESSKFRFEKNLVQAFTFAMPEGNYEAGIDSFAGVSTEDWVEQPLAPFSRRAMIEGAARISPLGATTPLARAIQYQKMEVIGKRGRGALLVFSDGKVLNPSEVLQACRDLKAAHGGEFCIYTVLIGADRDGRQLMWDMAAVNGCGKFYDATFLNTAAAVDAMARDIFLGMDAVTVSSSEPLPLSLQNILFDNDSSLVAASYDEQLDAIVSLMSKNPSMRIRLDGHTDFHASDAYNQKLSERRVTAVRDALMLHGAEETGLMMHAYGEMRPIVPNDSPEHLHMNRRVTLTVVD